MRIGVDIGGTFTDLVLIDESSGTVRLGKLLTTPENPTRAVMDGIARLLHDAGVAARAVRTLVHGTTLVTNAIIERKGAKTALITTRGFRDTLEIAREGRYDMYDLFIDPPEPLVPRRMRFEVGERVQHDGTVLIALEDCEAMRAIREAVGSGARAIAVWPRTKSAGSTIARLTTRRGRRPSPPTPDRPAPANPPPCWP